MIMVEAKVTGTEQSQTGMSITLDSLSDEE